MKKTVYFLLLLTAGLFTASQADVFIDWKAGFYVEYPSNWRHVDYNEVNDFLIINGIDPDAFDFDAVLAETSDRPFFEGPYIFLSYEPVGPLNRGQIDSSLKAVAAEYGERKFVQGSISKAGMNLNDNVPYYDAAARTVLTRSSVTTSRGATVLMDFRRYYEKGIAVFLCYSPGTISAVNLPIFIDIINSLSTKDLEKMAPEESLNVVDVAPAENEIAAPDSTDSQNVNNISAEPPSENTGASTFSYVVIILVILGGVLIVVVIGFLTKKRNT